MEHEHNSNLPRLTVLKLLIPIVSRKGALEAARHGAFLFAEHCVSAVEIVEVLEEVGHSRTSAFRSLGELRRQEKDEMRDALLRTCAILDDAGVPYTWKRVFGPADRQIATCARRGNADLVLLDATGLGFFSRWGMFAKLWRLSSTPVTLLH
ncbi:universal stress protein [Paraburkholderia phosphatilytica]|uniref:universal stress protein n=1 Tax=Paraburkholderia phosphatilytica TaxID=2282883 RepID=UPI001F0C5ECE|nr:universal stress protein [Paraburkholderia phosphatilytica]